MTNHTEQIKQVRQQAETSRIGYARPDGWTVGGRVYLDDTMPAPFDVRIETGNGIIPSLAVRVERTGGTPNRAGMYRCRITFLGDGEPDVVTGGWMTLD